MVANLEWSRYLRSLKPMVFDLVEEARESEVITRNLGTELALTYLDAVADSLAWLSSDDGTFQWNVFEIQGGGCFLAPTGIEVIRLHRIDRNFDQKLGPVSAGLCATMFANNRLLHEYSEKFMRAKALERQDRHLRKLAIRQPDGREIRSVLD